MELKFVFSSFFFMFVCPSCSSCSVADLSLLVPWQNLFFSPSEKKRTTEFTRRKKNERTGFALRTLRALREKALLSRRARKGRKEKTCENLCSNRPHIFGLSGQSLSGLTASGCAAPTFSAEIPATIKFSGATGTPARRRSIAS